MTFFHFGNCVALAYIPYVIIYKCSGLWVGFWLLTNVVWNQNGHSIDRLGFNSQVDVGCDCGAGTFLIFSQIECDWTPLWYICSEVTCWCKQTELCRDSVYVELAWTAALFLPLFLLHSVSLNASRTEYIICPLGMWTCRRCLCCIA